MKVVIDSAIPYIEGVLEPFAEVIYRAGNDFARDIVIDADVLVIRTRTRCNEALLRGSKVKMIATATIGFDHIDLDYCQAHDIKVVTAAGCNAAGVLQWVAATLAALSSDEGWQPQDKTLGIIGVGNVGSLVEYYAHTWGFRILRCDPPRKEREGGDFSPLEEVVTQSDIITFHTPLDPTTHHLIDDSLISLMRPNATIINASRGEVASTEALLRAPQRVCIDVWEREPEIDRALLAKSFISTPHIAGYSAQGKANATAMVVTAIANHFALPIHDWYPPQVSPATRRPINWEEMCRTINTYCDIKQESLALREAPDKFEDIRNSYRYREEYF